MNKIYQGNVFDIIKTLSSNSVDCVITSPPYFGLVDYGVEGQMGLEPTLEQYVDNLCNLFDEIKRVVKPMGSVWVNLGDAYAGGGGRGVEQNIKKTITEERPKGVEPDFSPKAKLRGKYGKSLLQIPARFAIEMITRRWKLRNQIIWHKTNKMPECLSPITKVFVCDKNNEIKHITLENLEQLNWKDYKILSCSGWVGIINIWKTKQPSITFKTGFVDDIECSVNHRFARVKDTHKFRNNPITFVSPIDFKKGHMIVYGDMSRYLKGNVFEIDLTKIGNIKWVVNFTNLSNESFKNIIRLTPLELAKKVGDNSLRKIKTKSSWTYGSDIHNEYRRKRFKIENIKKLDISFDCISAVGSKKIEYRYQKLDYELGWMLGIICAEGGFNQPRGHQGKITIHKDEVDIREKFIKGLREKFLVESNCYFKNNYVSIQFSSASLRNLYEHLVSGKCINKQLNVDFMINAHHVFRKGFLDGYLDGDGSFRYGGFSVTSASSKLINDIQILFSSLGKITSKNDYVSKDKRTKRTYKNKKLWTNTNYERNNFNLIRVMDVNYGLEKDFIDIEVEGDNTFFVENGLISHNSVRDRFTHDYEFLFFFTKQKKYYFKQQKEETRVVSKDREGSRALYKAEELRNKRSVWSIATKPFKKAHFATFPYDLIETPIRASCPIDGVVLDPFMGSGTTAVAVLNINKIDLANRSYVGIELNPEYVKLSEERISNFIKTGNIY